jgi:hypothetical protein
VTKGLFGIYASPQSPNMARDNVRAVFPKIRHRLSEETKFGFGVRYARYKASLDGAQASPARELLEALGAASYLPEDVRVAEIDEILDRLIAVHSALNNFYNEPPLARELRDYIGGKPVPSEVEERYVYTLIEVHLGRPSGISSGFVRRGRIVEHAVIIATPRPASSAVRRRRVDRSPHLCAVRRCRVAWPLAARRSKRGTSAVRILPLSVATRCRTFEQSVDLRFDLMSMT